MKNKKMSIRISEENLAAIKSEKRRSQTMSKNKHLTLDDRIEIQECLAKGMTFKAILRRI